MTTRPGLDDERVRQWVAAMPPRWLRWVLVTLVAGAFGFSVLGDTRPCSTADPTVCGPDPLFSVAIVFCIGSAALLWWRPYVAVACAVVFAIIDLAYDDVWQANVAWPIVAAAYVAYAVRLLRARSRQRAIAAAASVPLPPRPHAPSRPLHWDGTHRLMAAAALGLLLLSGGALWGYEQALASDAEHEVRSEVVEGTVLSPPDDDYLQRVRLDRRPEGFPAEVEVEFFDESAVGQVVQLRVDPKDPGWTHPTGEPPDRTWWLTISVGALLLAALLAERVVALRVRRGVLESRQATTGIPVRVFTDGLEFVGVVALDSTRGLAEFPVDETLLLDTPEARRVAAPSEGMLIGDVRDGGWVALAGPDGIRLPTGPLIALPPDSQVDLDSFDRDPDDPLDWSDPVPTGSEPMPLPVDIVPPVWRRALGGLVCVAALAVGGWLLWDPEVGWSGVAVVLAGAGAFEWGLEQVFSRATVSQNGFDVVTVLRRVTSPMGAVRDVRVDDETALVIFDDESVLDVSPPDGDHHALAAAIQRAVETAPPVPDGTAPQSRLAPSAFLLAAGVLTLAGVWLAQLLG